jgi:hypothetical protein
MPRVAEEPRRVRLLDDPAQVHHRDPGGDVLDHGEVVADEDVGEAEVPAQLGEQVEDL